MAQILYVTEKQAAEKWCPKSMGFHHMDNDSGVSTNRYHRGGGNTHCQCLGSRCMWWVWVSGSDAGQKDRRSGFCGALMR